MAKKPTLDLTKYVRFYEQMVYIREFEELIGKEWNNAAAHGMGGYMHLYSGEEAIAVGLIGGMDLSAGDCFIGHYRDHGYALAAGSDPGEVMAEICGKATGCSKGKGGSMHICDAARGFYGGYGIVGGNVPIALGLGWALKYRNQKNVCACFFGDGSMNQGAFHETLNMAQLYKVPVIFALENNGYAMGTSIERSHANQDLRSRVDSFAMRSVTINGQDIFEVHEQMAQIIQEMKEEPHPVFVEFKTYRYHGHGAADTPVTQSTYRTRDEVARAKEEKDPIKFAQAKLIELGVLTDEMITDIQSRAYASAEAAMKFSDDSPYPDPSELIKDVYA